LPQQRRCCYTTGGRGSVNSESLAKDGSPPLTQGRRLSGGRTDAMRNCSRSPVLSCPWEVKWDCAVSRLVKTFKSRSNGNTTEERSMRPVQHSEFRPENRPLKNENEGIFYIMVDKIKYKRESPSFSNFCEVQTALRGEQDTQGCMCRSAAAVGARGAAV